MTRSSRSGAAGNERRTRALRLPPAARIGSGRDIRRVMRSGSRSRGRFADVFCSPSPVSHPRFAVVVPRYGHGAVARNRVKRRLRELLRREWLPAAVSTGTAVDLVVRAKPSAYGVSYERLRESLSGPLSDACAR